MPGLHISMLAWLFLVFSLISAMQPPQGDELFMLANLAKDPLTASLSGLDILGLYNGLAASKGFKAILLPILQSRYGIRCNGKIYLHYTTVLEKFDAPEVAAFDGQVAVGAKRMLEGTPELINIKAVLEAEFGFCICDCGEKLRFLPKLELLQMLSDAKKVSALPYCLDQNPESGEWIYCIRGLVELDRVDLLGLMKFPAIKEHHFYKLLSVSLPKSVLLAAVRALQRSEPDLPVLELLAFAVLREKDACALEGPVPLFILQHMYESHMDVPTNWVFTGGLLEQSISFWTYLMGKKPEEVKELLHIIMTQGDPDTTCLASVFHGEVLSDDIPAAAKDVYQAILTRFNASLHRNVYVTTNFNLMMQSQPEIGYHSMRALLGCGNFKQIGQCTLQLTLEELMDAMYQPGIGNLLPLVDGYLWKNQRPAFLLKNLLKRNADDLYIQFVWDWAQNYHIADFIDGNCCLLPVDSMRRFMFEENMSVHDAEEILSEVQAYQGVNGMVSREAASLYMAIFWEAPENVILHFLSKVDPDYKLDFMHAWGVYHLKKYSPELWKGLFEHMDLSRRIHAIECRRIEKRRLKVGDPIPTRMCSASRVHCRLAASVCFISSESGAFAFHGPLMSFWS